MASSRTASNPEATAEEKQLTIEGSVFVLIVPLLLFNIAMLEWWMRSTISNDNDSVLLEGEKKNNQCYLFTYALLFIKRSPHSLLKGGHIRRKLGRHSADSSNTTSF